LVVSSSLGLRIFDVQPAANISLVSLTEIDSLFIQPQQAELCSQATRGFPASLYMNRLATVRSISCSCCAGEWHGFPLMASVTDTFTLAQSQDLTVHGFHNVDFEKFYVQAGSVVLAGFDNCRVTQDLSFMSAIKLEITGFNGEFSAARFRVERNQVVSISGFNGVVTLVQDLIANSFMDNGRVNITGFNGVVNFPDIDCPFEGNNELYLSGFNGQVTMKSLTIRSSQVVVVDGFRGSLTTVNAIDISSNRGSVSLPGLSGNITVGTSLIVEVRQDMVEAMRSGVLDITLWL